MKKIFTLVAAFLIAAMSLGSTTAFAAEAPEFSRPSERPAFLENAGIREKPELTDEMIAKIESGEFKPEMAAFIGRDFAGMNVKPGKWAELTGEEKAAMLENIKASVGDNFPAGRLAQLKNAVPGMKLAAAE